VTHPDGLRTTYQPVSAMVVTGDTVAAGQQIGVLLAGHATLPCLHLGLLRGGQYLDPLAWLTDGSSASPIRLLPDGTTIASAVTGAPIMAPTANGWPVVGPITSPFGWRTDPINGTKSFHSGTDIAAPCGTPVAAPIDGTVVVVAQDSSLGNYVVVSHAGGLRTTYAHLSAQLAAVGQPLVVGQVLGLVGQTGRATGCHLHFGATRDGVAIDSRTLLP
jgi:murein DD-endopeptidase MepM/ murein hydrolase activator NlpD